MAEFEGTKMDSKKLNLFLLRAVIVIVLGVFYVPLLAVCWKAFMGPEGFGFYWFQALLADPSFLTAFGNSLQCALLSSVLSVSLSLVFILRNPRTVRTAPVFYDRVMLLSLSMPEIVMALSLLSVFVWLKFSLGFGSTVVAHTTLTLAFSYWILSLQYRNLDPSLIEAAIDLGATTRPLLFQIILPQMKPAIVSGFWICFLISMDDFLITFFVSGSGFETLPLKLFSMLKVGLSPKINALSFLILALSGAILASLYRVLKKLSGASHEG